MARKSNRENCVFSEGNPEIRSIIDKFSGVFSFSDNQELFCNFCRLEITASGDKTISEEVGQHVNSKEHSHKVKVFREKDNRKKQASLLDALRDETLVSLSDGFVRCVYCDLLLSDSLTHLKNHLVSLDHIFKVFGFGHDGDGTQKRKSAKMIYLVAQTAELDFHKENGSMKVLCKRCEYIIEPTYQSVKYHLDSKKHNSRSAYDLDDNETCDMKSTNDTKTATTSSATNTPAQDSKTYKSRKPRTRATKRTKTAQEPKAKQQESQGQQQSQSAAVVENEPPSQIEVQPDMITLTEDSFYVVESFTFPDQHPFDIIVAAPTEDDSQKDSAA